MHPREQDVQVEITVPQCDVMEPPYPIVYFYQGFGARARDYYSYADRLASWGYAVLQHNANTGDRDELELGFYPDVMEAVKSSSVGQDLDFTKVGTAGHSRGGRLAAMTLEQQDDVSFGILIDPVDDDQRSGSRSLGNLGHPVAIIGSSLTTECFPSEITYEEFFAQSASGTWLQVIQDAGHSQFSMAAEGVIQRQVDPCARGDRAIVDILELTYPTMVAWADYQLHGVETNRYFDWVRTQEEEEHITWQER